MKLLPQSQGRDKTLAKRSSKELAGKRNHRSNKSCNCRHNAPKSLVLIGIEGGLSSKSRLSIEV